MNIHYTQPQFAPVFGLFAAKYGAICRKTHCILVLNAVCFGAKRKVKCGKMGDEKHKNTHQGDRQNLFEALKIELKRGKTYIKSGVFVAKSG